MAEENNPRQRSLSSGVRFFGREVDKWALNFGVGSAFALMLLVAAIYFVNRLANAQDGVALAQIEVSKVVGKMELLISQAAAADAERQTRAEGHYAEAARQYTETARRELDAIQRSEKLLQAIQAVLDRAGPPKRSAGGGGA